MEHGVPAHELTDEELERQGVHAHATRHWVFLHGTAEQFRTHTHRMLELEQDYLRRHPQRTWQGSGPEGAPPPDTVAELTSDTVAAATQTSRIRDLVHTFVREIDFLLGSDEDDSESAPGTAERQLLARVAAAPDGQLHKLEVHQIAREVGSTPRAVAGLYKTDPPLLRADGDHRVITDAGLTWLVEHPDTDPDAAPAPAPAPASPAPSGGRS
ncbi:MAG: DUF6158 family protein [Actinomycetota bacterium]|nr:DUF6158 family protein [Actinomycetota bacterium]